MVAVPIALAGDELLADNAEGGCAVTGRVLRDTLSVAALLTRDVVARGSPKHAPHLVATAIRLPAGPGTTHYVVVSAAAAAGFGFGFLVAAQVGPIWLLCMRSVLRGRFMIGFAIGVGAAVIDTTYAALGVAGAAGILSTLPQLRLVLGLLGAAVLVGLGARTMWTALLVRQGLETTNDVASPRRALVTALVATASNPLTIASWAAIFTAASAAHIARSPQEAVVFLVGIGAGSLSWFTVLAAAASVARRHLGSGVVRWVDAASGAGLVGFGGMLGWRSLHGH